MGPQQEHTSRRSALRDAALGCGAVVCLALAGCPPPARVPPPQAAASAFVEAVRSADLHAAWALLPPQQRGADPESFRPRFEHLRAALFANSGGETGAAATLQWHLEVVAEPADAPATRLPLSHEAGRWWVVAGSPDRPGPVVDPEPVAALRTFVVALRTQRYTDLWAVMPAAYRAELTPADLAERLSRRRTEMDALAGALQPLLFAPLDASGSVAHLTGDSLRVRLQREADGRWVVADPGWAPIASEQPPPPPPQPERPPVDVTGPRT